ncbi:hypothetical protein LOD99_11093 [Oopsacas minuta]|uniref:Uncharacterized protein n=1 Tax=Oopsacas minuta TaxID=111878 RepID=A0AAV7KAY8_9METZ|nr:hypothetical protein LOD99_11093 [Oopsacas minuta]
MSRSGLSELHFIPPKRSVNTDYYINEILEKCCLLPLSVERLESSHTKENVSKDVRDNFHAGWLPCPYSHRDPELAFRASTWLWEKGVWPSNSPDLNPIKIFCLLCKEN